MSTMDCNEFLNHIDDWIEGMEIPGARDHSRECAQCRALADDLGAIRIGAVTYLETDVEAPARVWVAIRAQLEQEGLIRNSNARPVTTRDGWFASIFSFVPRPALATAYVGVLVLAGIGLSGPIHIRKSEDPWLATTQSSTATLSAQLQTAETDAVAQLASFRPDVTSDLRNNLAIVDNDIALCEKSVQEEPESEIARDYLYSAYQQKADLLAQIGEHGDDGR
jgi:hypothetical protein